MKNVFAVCFAIVVSACNNHSSHSGHANDTATNNNAHHPAPTTATNPVEAEMDRMMADMMALELSGNPDRDFALLMKAHHQAAVNMAKLQLQKGKDTTVRAFAQQVVADQSKEIEAFNRVLQSAHTKGNDQALSDSMMQAMHQYMEPYQPLKNDADHDFLALMIPHHQGAVVMTEIYLPKSKNQHLRQLGNTIIKNQKKEIEQMKSWLKSL